MKKAALSSPPDIALLVGPIRILVNNAGIFMRGPLSTAGRVAQRWDRTMEVNVQGPFNVTMAFIDQLKHTHGSHREHRLDQFVRGGARRRRLSGLRKGALAAVHRALAGRTKKKN